MARYDLGLTDAEFRALTPREFDALCKRHDLAQAREDYRVGVLVALTANLHRGAKKRHRPYTPHDFFPSIPKPQRPAQTAEQMLADVVAFVRRGERSK